MFDGCIEGYADEQVAFATQTMPDPLRGTTHFTVVLGAHDFIHDPEETLAYWRAVLPDAVFVTIADAGRFLTFSHADRVVAELLAIRGQE